MITNAREDRRRSELRQSILEQMREVEDSERLRWLCAQLSEYADRWLGFLDATHDKEGGLISGDLFWVLEEATDVLQDRVQAVRGNPAQLNAVRDVVESIKAIGNGDLDTARSLGGDIKRLVDTF